MSRWPRARALAAAHNTLIAGDWNRASLTSPSTPPSSLTCGEGDRIRLDVEDLRLNPAVTPTLALGFHELATNAAKYWALSNPTGRLWFTSRVGSGERGEELRLTWQEQGGPDVQPPEALGFGMTMLSRTIEYQHSGKVELDWRREGLVCRLILPLPESSAAKRSNSSGN